MSNSGRFRVRKDRFYSPPAMRRYNQQQQEVQPAQHQEKQEQLMTNLDRFMKHTTPIVTAQHIPKSSMKGWRNNEEDDHQAYFVLEDLWESFNEWSAYGAGVPLVLNERDSAIQYYAPSLSAIQLYIDPSAPLTTLRRQGEDSDYESSRATSSDSSSYEAMVNKGPPGLLVFEYYERVSPFHRVPLANKISELASKFPKLKTYRSCDLTQSSWISVAWYPIYRIPIGPTLQNVDTSFLTFHSLSTPLRSSTAMEFHELSLPVFGLAVYKFKNSDWTVSGAHGAEKIESLLHSSENWLRRLGVHHPDFVFFKNRGLCR